MDGVPSPPFCGQGAGGQPLLWRLCLAPALSQDMFICNIWSQDTSLGDRDLGTSKQKKEVGTQRPV